MLISVESLADGECDINTITDNSVAHPIAVLNKNSSWKTEITNNISGHTTLQNKMIGNTAESSFNNHASTSQDESTENDIVSIPVKSTKRNKAKNLTSDIKCNTLCCKISLSFLMCCIIGCRLISVVLYYVNKTQGDALTDPEYSAKKNISNAKVSCNLL